jgi:hypothetical protein
MTPTAGRCPQGRRSGRAKRFNDLPVDVLASHAGRMQPVEESAVNNIRRPLGRRIIYEGLTFFRPLVGSPKKLQAMSQEA